MPRSLLTLVRRLPHGFWALADQGAVSLGSFLAIVFLGRELHQTDYGLYTLIYAAMLFLNTIHGALVTYPLLVRGAGRSVEEFARLIGVSVNLALVLNLLLGSSLAMLLLAFDGAAVVPWALAALFCAQMHETMRRALMARLRHARTIAGDAVAYLGFPAALAALSWAGALGVPAAFAAMAAAFTVGALVHRAQLTLRIARPGETWRAAVEQWPVVRWVLIANLVSMVGVQLMPWILVIFHDLDAAATLRALINPVALCHPIMFGIGNAIVPMVAQARTTERTAEVARTSLRQGAPMILLLAPYLAALLAFPYATLELFYGAGSVYVADAPALKWAVIGYGFLLGTTLVEAILKGLERTRDVFRAQLAGIAVTLAAGFPLAAWLGVEGATAGLMLSLAGQFLWNLRVIMTIFAADHLPIPNGLASTMRETQIK